MKRGALEHPKMVELRDVLNLPLYQAAGVMETIWHFTANYAPHGNIGRFSNRSIAKALEWDGDHDELVAALVKIGWLDTHEKFRLLVHDWPMHADNSVHLKLKRRGETFSDGTVPYTRLATDGTNKNSSRDNVATESEQSQDNVTSRVPLPEAGSLKPEAKEIPADAGPADPPKKANGHSWLEPYDAEWLARFGGPLPVKPSLRPLSTVRDQLGDDRAVAVWRYYLAHQDPEFATPANFSQKFGMWAEKMAAADRPENKPGIVRELVGEDHWFRCSACGDMHSVKYGIERPHCTRQEAVG